MALLKTKVCKSLRTTIVPSMPILPLASIIAQSDEFGKSRAHPSGLRLTRVPRCTIIYTASFGSIALARWGMTIVASDRVHPWNSRPGGLRHPSATLSPLPDLHIALSGASNSSVERAKTEPDCAVTFDRERKPRIVASKDLPGKRTADPSARHPFAGKSTVGSSEFGQGFGHSVNLG